MLAQHDTLIKPNLRVGVEAALSCQRDLMPDSVKVLTLKICDILASDSHTIWADLLVVSHNDHFLCYVEEEKAFDT